jgi:hypothetical protein
MLSARGEAGFSSPKKGPALRGAGGYGEPDLSGALLSEPGSPCGKSVCSPVGVSGEEGWDDVGDVFERVVREGGCPVNRFSFILYTGQSCADQRRI